MKKDLVEIVAILDRSGSMDHLSNDTIGGYNSFIESQKKVEGECKVSLVLFDSEYDEIYNGLDINDVPELTKKIYYARGSTSMLDAIGKTIFSIGARLNSTPEEERPEQVIFMITTDGEENTSKEFTLDMIKRTIINQTDKYGWEFIFMGANIDSIDVGNSIGVSNGMSMNYIPTSEGTEVLYSAVSIGIKKKRGDSSVTLDMASEYSSLIEDDNV